MPSPRSLVVVALTLTAAACSSTSPEPEPLTRAQAPVIRGSDSDTSQDWVVRLVALGGLAPEACTGSLIAPNLVLTARHCVAVVPRAPFGCDDKGNLLPGSTGGTPTVDLDPKNIYVFTGNTRTTDDPSTANAHGVKIVHDGGKNLCGHDLALLYLDSPLDGVPIGKLRLDADAKDGETITAIGWGLTADSTRPTTRQQRAGIPVLHVGPFAGDPLTASPVPPGDFSVGESICAGDSGGPGAADSTGAILGVVSGGGNGQTPKNPADTCIGRYTTNLFTTVASHKDMILAAFAEVGQEPWLEGGPDPRLAKAGGKCSDDGACRSAVCVNSVCAQSCASEACGAGTECQVVRGNKACVTKESSGCALAPSPAPKDGRAPLAPLAILAVFGATALARGWSRKRR